MTNAWSCLQQHLSQESLMPAVLIQPYPVIILRDNSIRFEILPFPYPACFSTAHNSHASTSSRVAVPWTVCRLRPLHAPQSPAACPDCIGTIKAFRRWALQRSSEMSSRTQIQTVQPLGLQVWKVEVYVPRDWHSHHILQILVCFIILWRGHNSFNPIIAHIR